MCLITKKATDPVRQLGYTGPGWYHRAMAEHLLHYGPITWDDVSATMKSTGHLPAGIFAKPLRLMEEAWEGIDDGKALCKMAVNALIGLMALDQSKLYTHHSSTSPTDMPEQATLQSTLSAGDQTPYSFVTVQSLMSNCSHRPVHDLCLSVEGV